MRFGGQIGPVRTKWLSRVDAALADLLGRRIDKVHQQRSPKRIVPDMDSSESDPWRAGRQHRQRSLWLHVVELVKTHEQRVVARVERWALRPGNAPSADGWRAALEPVIARYRETVKRLYFPGDAAFSNPEMCELLETDGAGYTIRLATNNVLQRADLEVGSRWRLATATARISTTRTGSTADRSAA